MSQSAVRNAVADYYQAQNFPRTVVVFKAIPYSFPDVAWELQDPSTWASLIAFNIDSFNERRIGMPSAGNSVGSPVGQKMRTYQCSLLLCQQYMLPIVSAPGEDAASYVDMLDEGIEEVVAALHADPNLGTGDTGVVWQAGQSEAGISTEQEVPKFNSDQSGIFAWTRIMFELDEIIQA